MVTGRRPFEGDNPASVLSSILNDTPQSVTELNPDVPRDLAKLIRRCLSKDPERCYQSAKDIRNELEELKREVDSGEAVAGATPPHLKQAVGYKRLWLPGAVVAIAALTWMVWPLGDSTRQAVPRLANRVQVTSAIGFEDYPAWSPDGRTLAYTVGPRWQHSWSQLGHLGRPSSKRTTRQPNGRLWRKGLLS